jgi:hypothetical protein
VDGKLDHAATAAELRRCIETLLRKARLELSFEIRSITPSASAELENPEILVVFKGRDQDLLLERNAELLLALEHIALRWLWLDPQFYGRIRFDAGDYRALRIEELKLSARVAADPAPGFEGRTRRANCQRRRGRRTPAGCLSRRIVKIIRGTIRKTFRAAHSGLLNPCEITFPAASKTI